MKKLMLLILTPVLIAAVAISVSFTPSTANGNDYVAQMKGCTDCGSCKKKVVMAFAKLDGVTTVRFLKKKKGDLHQVVVETDGIETLSINDATNALSGLTHFELKSWERQGN